MFDFVIDALVWMIDVCYGLIPNYWVAILLFTFLTKVLLLPLSVWIQKNSIKTVKMQPEINHIKAVYFGNSEMISEEQYKIFKREKYNPFADLIPLFVQLALLMGVVEAIKAGTNLTTVPYEALGSTLVIPAVAALSAFVMCFVQNKSNVLQAEQSKLNQYLTMTISVGLSLYLGIFVSVGVGFYWICSNLLSTLQLILLNLWINPKHYIDYEKLEESKQELAQAKLFMATKKNAKQDKKYSAKAKADYKRFLSGPYKKVVFYSERNGFYKYYQNIIEQIIARTNIVVHYITSDPCDKVFELTSDQFKPYYIDENRLIVLLMKLEADICVMTTPDLNNYHLKRSLVKKDIEYIYVPHDVNSSNLTFHKEALDHFDTIFTSGYKNKAEIAEREEKFGVKKKQLVEWGSNVIDNMIEAVNALNESRAGETEGATERKKTVLIAPSWQKDNIMDSCVEEMLDSLKDSGHKIIVRPHPQYVKHFEAKVDHLAQKYADFDVTVQKDFTSNKTVYSADVLVTDWSSIAFEYAFSTLRPVLFVNTPMKVVNEDYQELSEVPIDLELRDVVGISIDEKDAPNALAAVHTLLSDEKFSADSLAQLREKYIYNVGKSGEVGAKYIIKRLIEIEKRR